LDEFVSASDCTPTADTVDGLTSDAAARVGEATVPVIGAAAFVTGVRLDVSISGGNGGKVAGRGGRAGRDDAGADTVGGTEIGVARAVAVVTRATVAAAGVGLGAADIGVGLGAGVEVEANAGVRVGVGFVDADKLTKLGRTPAPNADAAGGDADAADATDTKDGRAELVPFI
jgi:hypothetical protein